MTEWYYARGGQQAGPVTFEQLRELARSGNLDPIKDLAWNATMQDWRPAGQVPDLFTRSAPSGIPAADPSNPYAAPAATWNEVAASTMGIQLEEIPPGSEPIDIGACLKRGFDLTKRHFVTLLLVSLIYFGISIGLSMLQNMLVLLFTGLPNPETTATTTQAAFGSMPHNPAASAVSILMSVISHVISTFLTLGVTRIGLNLISGKEATVGLVFSEGGKLVRAIFGGILFALALVLGLMLLIVPGIYVLVRYGQFMTAIVDRDMGIMESFAYSSSLTTNNRGKLFLFYLLMGGIAIAGMLACCVGLLFAMPVIWMSSFVAYRWMQYGHRAALDHHGTTVPMLTTSGS